MPNPALDRMLDTAERLFAEQGLHATTVRQITCGADVNLAAVNYHFGSKQALVEAVFRRRLDSLNADRLARLEQALAHTDPPRLEEVLEALIRPALELGSRPPAEGGRFMRLLLRAWAENDSQLHRAIRREYAHVMRSFADAVSRALESPPPDLRRKLDFLIGALTYAMAETTAEELPDTAAALVRFAAAGLREPAPQSTTAHRSPGIPLENRT